MPTTNENSDFVAVRDIGMSQIRSLLTDWIPGGLLKGNEYSAAGLSGGKGSSFSFNTVTGDWGEFNSTEKVTGNGPIKLYAAIHSCTDYEALKSVAAIVGYDLKGGYKTAPQRTRVEQEIMKPGPFVTPSTLISPVPSGAMSPPREHPVLGKPTRIWEYLNADGETLLYIYRFDGVFNTIKNKNDKEFRPLTYRNGKFGPVWAWEAHDTPRPLYGLDKLGQNELAPVLVVEGEKSAGFASELLGGGWVVTTWPGGSNAAGGDKVDWSPLQGRDIYLWPDNDSSGSKAMSDAAIALRGLHGTLAKRVDIPKVWDSEVGQDITDLGAEWDASRVATWIMEHNNETKAEPAKKTKKNDRSNEPETAGEPITNNRHFVSLGYDGDKYFFMTATAMQIRSFELNQLCGETTLMYLAPDEYWIANATTRDGVGYSSKQAGRKLMELAHSIGRYDPSRVRKRGAVIDNGRCVYHLGNRLIVDGVETKSLSLPDSPYIYDLSFSMMDRWLPGMTAQEASQFQSLIDTLRFQNKADAEILCGLIISSMVCGALYWRTSGWLTGERANGKTWILKNIVLRSMGNLAYDSVGSSSEASVRGGLEGDSRTLVMDEAETESDGTASELGKIKTNILRPAAMGDGGIIRKSKPGGGGVISYPVRFNAIFASINPDLEHAADKDRFIEIPLRPNTEPSGERTNSDFAKLEHAVDVLLTTDYCLGLQARAICKMPTIIKNAETIAIAIVQVNGCERRLGDKYANPYAGALACRSDAVLTLDEAVSFVKDRGWDKHDAVAERKETSDGIACINWIMSSMVSFTPTGSGNVKMSVSDLVDCVYGNVLDSYGNPIRRVLEEEARTALRDVGISAATFGDTKIKGIAVWGHHPEMRKILNGRSWLNNVMPTLARLDGAIARYQAKFGPNNNKKSTWVPLSTIQAAHG